MDISFQSISHFRELGGYKAADGRTVRGGLLYRSGELTHVSDEDFSVLETLGIQTVFDLRSEKEQTEKPDRAGSYRVVRCPLANPERDSDVRYKNPVTYYDKLLHATESYYNFAFHTFAKGYLEFPYNKETLSQIFSALDRHETILFHCFGGKDRTGVVSMLIMAALGCDYETCKKDYMLHNEIAREEFAKYQDMIRQHGLNEWGEKLSVLSFKAWDHLFDAAWYAVFDVYNSIESYLEDQYGVTRARIDDWKNYYLE